MQDGHQDIYSDYSSLLEKTGKKIKHFARQQFHQRGFDITIDQWSILKTLYKAPPTSQVDLAKQCQKDTPTLTRILDLLEQKELITRKVSQQDRRRQMITLTLKGTKLVMKMLPQVKEIRMRAWQGLSEEDFKRFVKILNTITQNLSI